MFFFFLTSCPNLNIGLLCALGRCCCSSLVRDVFQIVVFLQKVFEILNKGHLLNDPEILVPNKFSMSSLSVMSYLYCYFLSLHWHEQTCLTPRWWCPTYIHSQTHSIALLPPSPSSSSQWQTLPLVLPDQLLSWAAHPCGGTVIWEKLKLVLSICLSFCPYMSVYPFYHKSDKEEREEIIKLDILWQNSSWLADLAMNGIRWLFDGSQKPGDMAFIPSHPCWLPAPWPKDSPISEDTLQILKSWRGPVVGLQGLLECIFLYTSVPER